MAQDAWKTAGAANNWAGMALDEKRGIVYVPTGSAIFDFYGGDRVGNDLFANSIWRSMRRQASCCGIFRACITIYGTGIFRRRPRW